MTYFTPIPCPKACGWRTGADAEREPVRAKAEVTRHTERCRGPR